jgi:peptide deformylase
MHIRYKGLDRTGTPIEREVTQFHAKVFQHEYDHLEGKLFIDRVEDSKTLGFRPELIAAGIG